MAENVAPWKAHNNNATMMMTTTTTTTTAMTTTGSKLFQYQYEASEAAGRKRSQRFTRRHAGRLFEDTSLSASTHKQLLQERALKQQKQLEARNADIEQLELEAWRVQQELQQHEEMRKRREKRKQERRFRQRQYRAARRLQCAYRCMKARLHLKTRYAMRALQAVVMLQSAIRSRQAERSYNAARAASIQIQARVRGVIQRGEYKCKLVAREVCAVEIQCAFRSSQARRRAGYLRRRLQAAERVQAMFRQWREAQRRRVILDEASALVESVLKAAIQPEKDCAPCVPSLGLSLDLSSLRGKDGKSSVASYHEEFLSKSDTFSLSWREQLEEEEGRFSSTTGTVGVGTTDANCEGDRSTVHGGVQTNAGASVAAAAALKKKMKGKIWKKASGVVKVIRSLRKMRRSEGDERARAMEKVAKLEAERLKKVRERAAKTKHAREEKERKRLQEEEELRRKKEDELNDRKRRFNEGLRDMRRKLRATAERQARERLQEQRRQKEEEREKSARQKKAKEDFVKKEAQRLEKLRKRAKLAAQKQAAEEKRMEEIRHRAAEEEAKRAEEALAERARRSAQILQARAEAEKKKRAEAARAHAEADRLREARKLELKEKAAELLEKAKKRVKERRRLEKKMQKNKKKSQEEGGGGDAPSRWEVHRKIAENARKEAALHAERKFRKAAAAKARRHRSKGKRKGKGKRRRAKDGTIKMSVLEREHRSSMSAGGDYGAKDDLRTPLALERDEDGRVEHAEDSPRRINSARGELESPSRSAFGYLKEGEKVATRISQHRSQRPLLIPKASWFTDPHQDLGDRCGSSQVAEKGGECGDASMLVCSGGEYDHEQQPSGREDVNVSKSESESESEGGDAASRTAPPLAYAFEEGIPMESPREPETNAVSDARSILPMRRRKESMHSYIRRATRHFEEQGRREAETYTNRTEQTVRSMKLRKGEPLLAFVDRARQALKGHEE
eukprot:g1742.t1